MPGSWETESREEDNSIARQVTYPFLLTWACRVEVFWGLGKAQQWDRD